MAQAGNRVFVARRLLAEDWNWGRRPWHLECFLALDVALAVFDKQGFLLFSEAGWLGSLRESESGEAISLPLKRF